MTKVKVLFFATDPLLDAAGRERTRLRLDEDVRAIHEAVSAADFRDALEFDVRWAVRPRDLLQAFNQARPQVVHFSGHGDEQGLVLVGDDGRPRPVTAAALVRLFRVFSGQVRLVVLNACFSREQAQAMVEYVDCAVGTRGLIPDEAAIRFGASFYRAIAFGHSVRHAYEQAGADLALAGYPDDVCPVLLVRDGVDAGDVVLVTPPAQSAAEGRHFVNVGYSTRAFGMFYFRDFDVGTLSIYPDEAVFRGEQRTVRLAGVWDVSHGKQGGDVFANWVRVRYGDRGSPSVGYFARQTMRENLFGGSEDLFTAFQSLLRPAG